uniref:hypothetical protein n=1 Tax=uncultured Allobacillus sp. TaxID=1638025 RepID=UPI0025990B17|nr:hypothetical protein [uncultured Allobacillus sp.]
MRRLQVKSKPSSMLKNQYGTWLFSFRTVIPDKLGSKYMTYLSSPSSRQRKSITLLAGIAFLQGSF